ncbi:MAG: hypothetical protein LBT46_02395 [Planctomycetaceae bacterium]|jgi:hypothetical protein|nr:hypothetical protein [Planctomycetaceae bacterium]
MTYLNTQTAFYGTNRSYYASAVPKILANNIQTAASSESVSNTADSATFSIRGWEAYQKIENKSLSEKKSSLNLSLPKSDGTETAQPQTRLNIQKNPSIEAINYALGIALAPEEENLISGLKRSTLLAVQAKMESTEESLNQRIAGALERAGIVFSEDERLDFSIDQDGHITVGEGITDAEKRSQMEAALNSDANIKNDLLLQQARKIVFEKRVSDTRIASTIIYDSYAWEKGQNSDLPGAEKIEFTFDFSYQNGKLFQEETASEERVFSDRLDSFAGLGKIIGLDESAATDISSFIDALQENVDKESGELTSLLNAAIDKAGLGSVKKKITFSQDAAGNIVIEGNLRADQKKSLARIINGDAELVERLKTQRAKKDVLAELQEAIRDEPDASKTTDVDDYLDVLHQYRSRPAGFDLSQESLASAREQLIKDYLNRNGISLDDVKHGTNDEPQPAVTEIRGLQNEIEKLGDTEPQSGMTPLFSMKQGLLSDPTAEPDFTDNIRKLREQVGKLVKEYNEKLAYYDEDLQISDFTITLDHKGRAKINVKTNGSDTESVLSAEHFLRAMFPSDATEALGKAILEAHDDEHGDVEEFRHQVVISKGSDDYLILSPDADKAALAEVEQLSSEVSAALNDFFKTSFNVQQPFNINFGADGTLSLEGLEGRMEGRIVNQYLSQMNERLLSDDPLNEDMFDNVLPAELQGVVGKLLALREAQGKLHDPAVKSQTQTVSFIISK